MKNMKKCTPVLGQALPLQHTAKKNEKEPSSLNNIIQDRTINF